MSTTHLPDATMSSTMRFLRLASQSMGIDAEAAGSTDPLLQTVAEGRWGKAGVGDPTLKP